MTTIKGPKNLKSPSFTWREFKHKQLLCSFSPETLLKPTSWTLLDNQRINRTLARVIASGTSLSLRDSPSMVIGCYLPCHGLFGFIKDRTAGTQEDKTRKWSTWRKLYMGNRWLLRSENLNKHIVQNKKLKSKIIYWESEIFVWVCGRVRDPWYLLSREDHQNEDINTHNGTKAHQAW